MTDYGPHFEQYEECGVCGFRDCRCFNPLYRAKYEALCREVYEAWDEVRDDEGGDE